MDFTAETLTTSNWDPTMSSDWDVQPYPAFGISRIKRDLETIYSDPLPFIFVYPEEDNITKLHAIISGPQHTPYEGGFFYFFIRMPPDYPVVPPRVKLMTTGCGTVRFNPNLYKNGKVCLSIIGTWSGPSWSAANSLKSLLLSIQSIMNENPYHNEPGFDKERRQGDAKNYNNCIQHETLRIAVLGMLNGMITLPVRLKEMAERTFLENVEHYEETIGNHIHLDGQRFKDPFGTNNGTFQYAVLLNSIRAITAELRIKYFGQGKMDLSGLNVEFP